MTNIARATPASETPGQIIERYQRISPVDVKGIANDLGLNVWEMDLPGNVSGKIFRDPLNGGSSGYSIGVNRSEGYKRKRFTLAHELAHFILHRDLIGDELMDDGMYRSDNVSSPLESQANNLAADILMPRRLIRCLQAQGCTSVGALAERLQVSEAAMKIRLSY